MKSVRQMRVHHLRLPLLLAAALLLLALCAPLAAAGLSDPLAVLAIRQAELTRTPAASGDHFGMSVAIDGETAIVGAYGVAGGGAAYVYTRSGATWSQEATLTAIGSRDGDSFGSGVAVSADTAVIGARGRDCAYVFNRTGTTWSQDATLTPIGGAAPDDAFGLTVALAGNTAVVGASGANTATGAAYVFRGSGATWSQEATLTAAAGAQGDFFGTSLAVDGDTALVGASLRAGGGAAYVFTRSGVTWSQEATLTANDAQENDQFGTSVALQASTALVGAEGASGGGAAYAFTRSGVTWTQQAKLTAGVAAAMFGTSVGIYGDTALVGAENVNDYGGAAYAFTRSGATWSLVTTLSPGPGVTNYGFGHAAALSGNTAVIGAYHKDVNTGTAFIYADGAYVWPSVAGGLAGHGSVSPDTTQTVAFGSTPAFTFAPQTGYHVTGVWVDGVPVLPTPLASYTFAPLTESKHLSVSFVGNTYQITSQAVGGGSISPWPRVTLPYGASQTYTFAASPGYHLASLTLDGKAVSPTSPGQFTIANLDANHFLQATFAVDTYIVTPQLLGGLGTISPMTPQSVSYRSTPTFTIRAASGYYAQVFLNGTRVVVMGTSYTLPPVTSNVTLAVRFVRL